MQKVYVVPILVCFMLAVILVSNILVQYPIFIFGLEDILTWAAFTYPIAFFITDITNKKLLDMDVRTNIMEQIFKYNE